MLMISRWTLISYAQNIWLLIAPDGLEKKKKNRRNSINEIVRSPIRVYEHEHGLVLIW